MVSTSSHRLLALKAESSSFPEFALAGGPISNSTGYWESGCLHRYASEQTGQLAFFFFFFLTVMLAKRTSWANLSVQGLWMVSCCTSYSSYFQHDLRSSKGWPGFRKSAETSATLIVVPFWQLVTYVLS